MPDRVTIATVVDPGGNQFAGSGPGRLLPTSMIPVPFRSADSQRPNGVRFSQLADLGFKDRGEHCLEAKS